MVTLSEIETKRTLMNALVSLEQKATSLNALADLSDQVVKSLITQEGLNQKTLGV